MTDEISVIIAAGGSSRRYGEADKLLEPLDGIPVFCHSIRNFSVVVSSEDMVVAVRSEALERYRTLAAEFLPDLPVRFVAGGKERCDSVRNALAVLPRQSGLIAIHDAARPLASSALLKKVAARAAQCGGAIAAVKVVDSLKLTDENGAVIQPVSRDMLYRAETPQVFDIVKFREAYRTVAVDGVTDDAEIMRRAGCRVDVVESGEFNVKLTSAGDMELLKIFYFAGK